jgi:UDP-N-acetylglucosamine 3-dehydrogenase
MVKKVSLALLGGGYWGSKLASEYIQLQKEWGNEGFTFFGVVDPDKERLSKIGNMLNLPSSMLYSKVEKCLNDQDVTAIHIATPSETHYNLAYQVLDKNKHVLLEKPMAMNSRDAFKLARLAEKKGQILLVGHIFRFNAALARAKEILERSAIGKINYLRLSWLDELKPIPNRDIIFDLLPHPIDIVNYLTDEWPSSIYAQSISYTRPAKRQREDMAFIITEMPDRTSAQITLSWIQPGIKERTVIVTGSEATMSIDTLTQGIRVFNSEGREEVKVDKNNTIKSMVCHFLKCILGSENPSNSSLVGAMTVSILSAARRSLSEKRGLAILE